MKKKKDKNRNKVIILITIVTLIIALVAGGTYSWWTWISSSNTVVNITVEGMEMLLDGGGNINVTNLVPTSCTSTTYAVHTTITYSLKNPTQIDSTGTIQLKPSTFPNALKNDKLMWKLTTGENCTGTEIASGNFGDTVQGTVMNLTTISVPANGIIESSVNGTYKPYHLTIWLDSTYTGTTNVGNTVKDTIQDKSMTLQLTGTIAQNPS